MSWPVSAEELVAKLRPDRVSAPNLPISAIGTRLSDTRLANYWAVITQQTAEALAGPEPTLPRSAVWEYLDTGARLPFEDAYFARRRRLAALGISALAGSADALSALPDLIAAVCEEPSWALPAHGGWGSAEDTTIVPSQIDLFAAETGNTLAELVTALTGLDDRVRTLVTDEVTRRVVDPLADPDTHFGWETWPNNWSAVCAGASGSAALLLERDEGRLVRILDRVLAALDVYLSGFGSDGGCAEGLGYWSYGMVHFIGFADLVERWTEGRVRLADDARARAAAAFPARVALPGGAVITFSDTTDDPIASSAVGWWQGRGIDLPTVPIEVLGQDPCGRWLSISRAPLWLPDENHGAARHHDLLADTGWLVVAADPFALAVKAGDNAESHNQLDLGQLSLWVGGEQLLLDPGSGVYTREYFADETRYGFFEPSSRAHNAPSLDGAQQTLGAEAKVEIISHDDSSIVLDLTSAYPTSTSVRRRVEWSSDLGEVTLLDSLTADAKEATWHLVSGVEPVVDGRTMTWRGSHGVLIGSVDSGSITVERLDTRAHHGADRTLWIVVVQSGLDEGVLDQRLVFRLSGDGSPR